MILTLIKKYAIPALLILTLVGGVYSFLGRRAALNQLTFQDGIYQQDKIVNAQIVAEKEVEIKKLQEYITVLDIRNKALVQSVDNATITIRRINQTVTDLEESRQLLTDKDAIIYNQDLQIQEYKKEHATQEQRFADLKTAFIYERSAKEAALVMAKDYYELWQKEKQLHMLSTNAYDAYKAQVKRQQFRLTVKGIGERILYAAAGYGLGRIAD